MAKISELNSNPSLSTDDLLYVVNDPAGSPGSYKATISALLGLLTSASATFSGSLTASGTSAGGATTVTLDPTTNAGINFAYPGLVAGVHTNGGIVRFGSTTGTPVRILSGGTTHIECLGGATTVTGTLATSGNFTVASGTAGGSVTAGQGPALQGYTYASIPTYFMGGRFASTHSLMCTSAWGALPSQHSPQWYVNNAEMALASNMPFVWFNGEANQSVASRDCRFRRTTTKEITFDDNAGGNATFAVTGKVKATTLNLSGLPTSSSGLSTGDVWNNSGVLTIV